jgi:FkbM family methyltransferase
MRAVDIRYKDVIVPFQVHDPVLTRLGRMPDFISRTIEETGTFFELPFLEYLWGRHPRIVSFVDVGANIGNHSVFAREVLGATDITCFEPDPANFAVLEANVGRSGAECHNVGLSSRPGTMEPVTEFIAIAGSPGLVIANKGATHLIPGQGVEVRTLDSYNLESCDILKIDVEGMEPDVLKGSTDTLTRLRPAIYAEANTVSDLASQMGVLAPLGYVMADYRDFGNPMACFVHGSRLNS